MQIFFDFDGTLVDISDRHHRVYSNIVIELGGEPLPKDEYWGLKRGNTSWEEILEKSKLHNKEQFLEKFISKIESPDELKQDKLFPKAKATLEKLSMNGHDLFLVSLRRNPDNFYFQLKHLGIEGIFKESISGHSDKPGEHTKTDLIKEIVADSNAIVIGDTEVDIKAAKSLSLVSIAVTSGIRNKENLEKLNPDKIIHSVADLKI